MSSLMRTFFQAVAWLVFGGLLAVVYVLIRHLADAPSTTSAPVSAALLAAVGLMVSKSYERKTQVLQEQRKVQAEIYEELLQKFMVAAKAGTESVEGELVEFFTRFNPKGVSAWI
jgi:hypothetical protein